MTDSGILYSYAWLIASVVGAIAAVLLGVTIWLIVRVRSLHRRVDRLTAGGAAASLEEVIARHGELLDAADTDIQNVYEAINALRDLVRQSVYRKGILRYNPFKDLGGDQSFAIALLDGDNSGIVISSLHTRDGTRVYAKPVIRGNADKHPFSDEERQAIMMARSGTITT